jgi:5-dehydro-2-deoxygluconokinase
MPTQHELEHLLAHGSSTLRLREDATLNHLHRAALRDADPSPLAILACDHRAQFEALAGEDETASARITAFKRLVTRGARRALAARTSPPVGGLIIDDRYGASLLLELDTEFWIARPVESPGQRPLEFERGRNIVSLLREWPRHHVAKCLVAFDPYDPLPMRRTQIDRMLDLAAACAATQRELLLEVVLPAIAPVAVADQRLLDAVREIGAAGVLPDWWKLPAPTSGDGWDRIASVVRTLDSQCRGVLVLGLDAPLAELAPRISTAAKHPVCRGFAVGRSIFGTAAREWFADRIDDDAAIEQIASRYGELVDLLEAEGTQASKRAGERATTTPPNQYDTTLLSEDSQWTGSVS